MKRIALVGLGKQDKLKRSSLDAVGAAIATLAKSAKSQTLAVLLPEGAADGAAVSKVSSACVSYQIMYACVPDRLFSYCRCYR